MINLTNNVEITEDIAGQFAEVVSLIPTGAMAWSSHIIKLSALLRQIAPKTGHVFRDLYLCTAIETQEHSL